MKIDLHTHSYYSKDGISSPEKLIKTALKKGLDGIALTDHNTNEGWEEAVKIAKKLNALLILGQEQKTKEGDIIGLFLKEEIKSREFFEVIKEIKSQGGIVVLPHPFHLPENFKGNIEKIKDLIEGIEVFNARFPFSGPDKKALALAEKYNLALLGGSDAHFHKGVGDAYTIAENVKNLEEFKKAILNRKTKVKGKKSSPFYLLCPTLGKLGLKEKRNKAD